LKWLKPQKPGNFTEKVERPWMEDGFPTVRFLGNWDEIIITVAWRSLEVTAFALWNGESIE